MASLSGGNTIRALNTYAVTTIKYGARIINWNKEELDRLDRQTRKLITMHEGLHSCSNVDKLYIPRTEGGRVLMSVRYCVEQERSNLSLHAVNRDEKLLKAASEEVRLKVSLERKNKEQGKEGKTEQLERESFIRVIFETN